jgi:isocitrate dehydrogenase (NAD+)
MSSLLRSGTMRRVIVFQGDGIGPEIVRAARRCVDAALVSQRAKPIDWLEQSFDGTGLKGLSESHLDLFDKHRLLFKGPLTVPSGAGGYVELRGRRFSSANQVFRKAFNLYANMRPSRSYEGIETPFKNVDWLVVRENTEDVYTGEEKLVRPPGGGVEAEYVEAIKRNSRRASRLVARRATEFALANGRQRLTVLHKANVCKLGDGLWLQETTATANEVLRAHGPGAKLQIDDQLADSMLFNAVLRPQQYDVLLCPNLIGDFVSDFAAGIVGSLGLCPSANLGTDYALFEPAHGSAPDIAGQGKANPISMALCGVLMLREIGEDRAAAALDKAIERAVAQRNVTPDLKGKRSTDECAQAIVDNLQS